MGDRGYSEPSQDPQLLRGLGMTSRSKAQLIIFISISLIMPVIIHADSTGLVIPNFNKSLSNIGSTSLFSVDKVLAPLNNLKEKWSGILEGLELGKLTEPLKSADPTKLTGLAKDFSGQSALGALKEIASFVLGLFLVVLNVISQVVKFILGLFT